VVSETAQTNVRIENTALSEIVAAVEKNFLQYRRTRFWRTNVQEAFLRHIEEIAVFGGQPLFASPKPVGQLAMPEFRQYEEVLKRILEGRRFTGGGPMVRELERRLAAFHEVRHCLAFANAGLALVMLMRVLARGRDGEVIMPAFSYRGLPHFARWAAQMPRFCDVERETHGLDVDSVASSINERVTCILAVSNVTGPCDVERLCALASASDVPIFFDSVYAFGSTYRGRRLGCFGRAEVFSMHATKLLNGFEGGYLTTDDDGLTQELRDLRDGSSVNVELSELHAAMALLCLDDVPAVIARNRERYLAYRTVCDGLQGLRLLPYRKDGEEAHNYEMAIVEVEPSWLLTRDETVRLLRAENAIIASYYSPPLHRSPHCPPEVVTPALPVSEDLSTRFLQLPVGELVSLEDIERLADYLQFINHRSEEIATRLRRATHA